MNTLIFLSPIVNTFLSYFMSIFAEQTKPCRERLRFLIMGIVLTGSLSIRKCYQHVISKLTDKRLKSFYYVLDQGKVRLSSWSKNLIELALSCPGYVMGAPILLVIDDTLVEKTGTHFEFWQKLFDHSGYRKARRGQSNSQGKKGDYINGHCFVTLLMLVPIMSGDKIVYRPVIVAQRMWKGNLSKLTMAAALVRLALSVIGKDRQVLLLCDSWYPKAKVAKLAKITNLDIICNARIDSAMNELVKPEKKPGRGRPRKYGAKVKAEDFELTPIPGTGYSAGVRIVTTKVFGDKEVAACVTRQGENGSRRLFFCTNLEACKFFLQHQASLPEGDAQSFVRADEKLVFLAVYSMRWAIETSYLELKTFWDFGEYRVRHKTSIERLLNLQSMVYSILSLLPALNNAFACMEGLSIQERRWRMEQLISRQIFFAKLGVQLQNDKNQSHFLQVCNELAMKDDLAA